MTDIIKKFVVCDDCLTVKRTLYIENYTFENSNEPRGNLKNDDLCLHKQIILEIDMRRLASSKLSKAKLREVALE